MEPLPLLVLKTGGTMPWLCKQLNGDFEDWTVGLAGLKTGQYRVLDVTKHSEQLPTHFDDFSGVFITGSHDMVTEHLPWSERVAEWLPNLVRSGKPCLGICYGHQLIAHALHGVAGDLKGGREFGTLPVSLTEAGAKDDLLGNIGVHNRVLFAHMAHKQAAIELPPGAVVLATSERDPHSSFRINNTWGVQFHPEFPAAAMNAYLQEFKEIMRREGLSVDSFSVQDTPLGPALLRRFVEICFARGKEK